MDETVAVTASQGKEAMEKAKHIKCAHTFPLWDMQRVVNSFMHLDHMLRRDPPWARCFILFTATPFTSMQAFECRCFYLHSCSEYIYFEIRLHRKLHTTFTLTVANWLCRFHKSVFIFSRSIIRVSPFSQPLLIICVLQIQNTSSRCIY